MHDRYAAKAQIPTRLQRRLTPPSLYITYSTGPPLRFATQTKSPTGFMTMHNLNALYFSPFVTVTEY